MQAVANPLAAVTIFTARRILTMNPAQPSATHVAVREGRILAVGDAADAAAWRAQHGACTTDDTLRDKVLMPGLVEGHCHLMEGAMWDAVYVGYYDRRGPDGTLWPGLRSLDAVLDRLAAAERAMNDDGPLLAWGFDPIFFGTARLTVRELDRVSARRPIAILHASVHLMNVNGAMLARAGIDEDTDVDGITRDADGRPTGELQEFAAMFPVYQTIGGKLAISASEKPHAIRNFGRVAQLAGVTTATDLVNDLSPDGNRTLRDVTDDPDFPVRIVPAFAPQRNPARGADSVLAAIGRNTDKLRFGPVKFIVDGSIQGFTARVRWPGYAGGQPNGLWLIPPAQLVDAFEPFHCAGLQLHVHTNGDEATEVVLDAMTTLLARHPRPDHRHTLQHCQMADAAQLARIRALGLCVNFFANHLYYWGDAHYSQTIGPDRANRMNPAGSARRLGVPFALHSDAPITPLNPLFTAWCAVRRETASGRVLGEGERIGVDDALRAITLGAAYTLKMDHLVGSIEVGKFADFAVLDDDPSACAPERLNTLTISGTVLGGRVFRSPR
ncbi:amidohydrolase [Burkholderia pseudomultivorans]|uniref:N-substituted formamide deformylase n=1 Tax=Burkholderia pseudomultivorans TaxID=1207504 RepID=A0ABU2E3S8_9BURK|nr:amidohydrolase [Burkholderia pseudomultivorans]MDR8729700.1 N-substituted formamide deformylase [Burkholderia pseudomultivorans]MDR8736963.1 N-substituted formamide deformylase [Burkholderia pseudomultivorans]MDR8743142.1 N-substituted formamide deformylase [Burkholderia pseudomultivorans]MDR8754517.1 N-substituted formamide deformylase [Burkholderia pseudomultivorans]MDR8779870.1 N-substituted formamide deformylase [Burkholderia pseudomultivorans]